MALPWWFMGANALASALAARGAARAGGMTVPATTTPEGLISPRTALVASIGTNVGSALWARHLSNTAHRREVVDLKKAGINPILTATGGRGASSDFGGFENPASSALAARQAQANIELTRAQAHLVRTQAGDISSSFAARTGALEAQAELSRMNADQLRRILPEALNRARAEIESSLGSARAARARAVLDEAARTGALNEQQLQEILKTAGPMTKFLLMVLRELRGVAR